MKSESQLPVKQIAYNIQIVSTYESLIEKVSIKTLQTKLSQNPALLSEKIRLLQLVRTKHLWYTVTARWKQVRYKVVLQH